MTSYSVIVSNFKKLDDSYELLVEEGKQMRVAIFDLLQQGFTHPGVIDDWKFNHERGFVAMVDKSISMTDGVMNVDSEGFQNLGEMEKEKFRKRRKDLIKLQEGLLADTNNFFACVGNLVTLYRLCESGTTAHTKAGKYALNSVNNTATNTTNATNTSNTSNIPNITNPGPFSFPSSHGSPKRADDISNIFNTILGKK
jgi:hypothetical protein